MMHTQIANLSETPLHRVTNLLNTLEQYEVSFTSGFVPTQASRPLPKSFEAWEELAKSLPDVLKYGNIVRDVNFLQPCNAGELATESQLQRAYVLLSYIVNAYVHGGRQTTVPPVLSDPFRCVCDRLGLQPVVSLASLCLFNFQEKHPQPSSHTEQAVAARSDVLSGLRCITTFTGSMDEEAFNLVPVLVERTGGPLIPLLLETLLAASAKDFSAVAVNLSQCASTLQAMSAALSELSLCKPDYFYTVIRPYIAGLDIDYQFSSGETVHVKLAGGSAAQASLFPFLDHVLGVKHTSPLLGEMRRYMPGKHRAFLEEVFTLPTLPDLIKVADVDGASLKMAENLKACRDELVSWRTKHLAIVSRYIVVPAAKSKQRHDGDVYESLEVAGTAGSSPLPFLKEVRDDVKPS